MQCFVGENRGGCGHNAFRLTRPRSSQILFVTTTAAAMFLFWFIQFKTVWMHNLQMKIRTLTVHGEIVYSWYGPWHVPIISGIFHLGPTKGTARLLCANTHRKSIQAMVLSCVKNLFVAKQSCRGLWGDTLVMI